MRQPFIPPCVFPCVADYSTHAHRRAPLHDPERPSYLSITVLELQNSLKSWYVDLDPIEPAIINRLLLTLCFLESRPARVLITPNFRRSLKATSRQPNPNRAKQIHDSLLLLVLAYLGQLVAQTFVRPVHRYCYEFKPLSG